MPQYDVHAYCTVRVKISNVEALDPVDAVAKVSDNVSFHNIFQAVLKDPSRMTTLPLLKTGQVSDVEFSDEVQDYLVDRHGDNDYSESRVYDTDGMVKKPWAVEVVRRRVRDRLSKGAADVAPIHKPVVFLHGNIEAGFTALGPFSSVDECNTACAGLEGRAVLLETVQTSGVKS